MSIKHDMTLSDLDHDATGTVAVLHGGGKFQQRLRTLGISEGKKLRMIAQHPFAGPVVIEIDGRQVTVGRGMAQKIGIAREE